MTVSIRHHVSRFALNQAFRFLPASSPVLLCLLVLGAPWSETAFADQVACSSNGSGVDTCVVFYPDVLHSTVTYNGVQIAAGDIVTATAAGCVQTGGAGKTWKRYLDPSGDNSGHLYHGLIQVPGAKTPVRIQSLTAPVTATAAGPLILGYEDDNYSDNGYWSHDDGTGGQCSDVNSTNHGRAFVTIQITRANQPFQPAGTAFGQCVQQGNNSEVCHIDRPDVTHPTEPYPAIQFSPGDQVSVAAQGCVQTGGSGKTWKRYVTPSGNNSANYYHGLITIPGATQSLERIQNVIGKTLPVTNAGILTLGYEDDDYSDNGYWNHDDGTEDQCKNVGAASLDITITHPAMPSGTHINVDGIEAVQSVQDLDQSVPLVAAKQTWVRVYLSGIVKPHFSILGTLLVTPMGGAAISVEPTAGLLLSTDGINARRARWTGSLNFLLPTMATNAGTVTLALTSPLAIGVVSPGHGERIAVPCNLCNQVSTVTFAAAPTLRVRLFSVSYQTPIGPNKVPTTFAPRQADFNLLNSWLVRAYPTASIQSSTVSIAGTIKPPFTDFNTCGDVDSQLSSLRASDIDSGSVDPRTHYYGLVYDGGGAVTGGFMRGCSDVPNSPDPGATGSGPAGQGEFGDTDASYADWYGGHELGHTFGRYHPGFCGETKDDPNYPFPGGTISDVEGSFVALDVGDPTVDTSTGALLAGVSPGAVPIPLAVLPGTTTTEIMTYCPQPEWPSSYTYEAILQRISAENAQFGGGISTDAEHLTLVSHVAVHVVASLDLTAMTGSIRYVLPISRQFRSPITGRPAELVVLDREGKVLSRTEVPLRSLSDRKPGEHELAIADGAVDFNPRMATIQVQVLGKVLAEFKSTTQVPRQPLSLRLLAPSATTEQLRSLQSHRLSWIKSESRIPTGPTFYTVEVSTDGKVWQTIAVGLSEPNLDLNPEQARMHIRVTAHNGFVKAEPLVLGPSNP